jgi:alpha-1,2-mannosyltransferase
MVISILRWTAVLLFGSVRAPPGFYVLVLLFALRFVDNNIGHGQINILLLWLILGAYVLAGRGRFSLAGLALAGAIAAKLVPAILLLQLLLRRQWRFVFATVAGFALLMATPLLWWGADYPQLLRDWATVVVDQVGHYEIANKINQSISAFAYRLFRPHPAGAPLVELPEAAVRLTTIAIHAAFVVPLVWLSLRLRSAGATKPQGPRGYELALYLLYSTVLSPYSWKYYFVNLAFPVAAAVQGVWEKRRPSLVTGLWVVFFLNFLPARDLVGRRLATLFQLGSFHFLAAALLFALLAREAFRASRADTDEKRDAEASGR